MAGMPRSNRPRRPGRRRERAEEPSLERLRSGWRRTEQRRGAEWTVQPVSPERARKRYLCPGCGRSIEPGVAHIVAWRADHLFGDDHALVERRHWHTACWRSA